MSSESAIQYQGRRARRQGSEQRRRAILEAALRIIVREGIRSVRHRAVAKEADVPLSATTYYFKDISDLIADAFTLFVEQAMQEVIGPFRDQVFAMLENLDPSAFSDPVARENLINTIADMTVAFIAGEVENKRDHLVAEQAFMHEAVLDPRLRELAQVYNDQQIEVLTLACEKMGTPDPKHDAELMISMFYRIEYQMLIAQGEKDREEIRDRLRHGMSLLVGTGQG